MSTYCSIDPLQQRWIWSSNKWGHHADVSPPINTAKVFYRATQATQHRGPLSLAGPSQASDPRPLSPPRVRPIWRKLMKNEKLKRWKQIRELMRTRHVRHQERGKERGYWLSRRRSSCQYRRLCWERHDRKQVKQCLWLVPDQNTHLRSRSELPGFMV